jgi:hypothetical protein
MQRRTDDDVLRTQLPFLGPKGFTLPVRWTFVQWGVGTAIVLPLSVIALLISPYLLGMAIAVGGFTAWLICRQISPDRPARAVARTIVTGWRVPRAPRDNQPGKPLRFSTRHLTGGDQP